MEIAKHATPVLVVDDDDLTADMLENALAHFGYQVTVAADGREALELVRTGKFRLVVSDWEMPEISGLELCRRIRNRSCGSYVYVILLTSRSGTDNVIEGLNAGADEFLSKPFHPHELLVRLRVGQRLLSLESREVTIFALAKLAESRDSETGEHLERMREYCRVLAVHLSGCPRFRDVVDGDYVQLLYLTSPLHDIGKVGIPDRVLLKPGQLTQEEIQIIRQHTTIGGDTLEAASHAHPGAAFLTMARDIAYHHHERYDGKGYPHGLSGDAIPLAARIVALADVYDALTTKRVYKPAFSHEDARSIIIAERSQQFDPDIVDAFLDAEADFVAIKERFDGPPIGAEAALALA